MSWLLSHPYTASLLGASVLIMIGAFIVSNRAAVETAETDARVWSGVATRLTDPTQSPAQPQGSPPPATLYSEVLEGPPFHFVPSPVPLPLPQTDAGDDFDFAGFLGSLTRPQTSTSVAAEEPVDSYSFIPTGLVSISSNTTERTDAQQALYDYGNEVGSYVETYDTIYRNAPQILKDQFEDRNNSAKNEALLQLAGGLGGIGDSMLTMEDVPSSVQSAHERLAVSYQDMGAKLALIPTMSGEQQLIQAMLTYNATVEAFTKNFVSLALVLSIQDVTFASSDPGSVFTFTPGSF